MGLALSIVLATLGASLPRGQLAYVSGTEQEDLRVSVIDIQTGQTAPVGPGNRDGAPVWSPDGQWLAFATRAGAGLGIHIVRHDGSDAQSLTHAHVWNRAPRWSPEEQRLIFRDGDSDSLEPWPRLVYAADDGTGLDARVVVYDLKTRTETEWGGGQTGLMRPIWVGGMRLLYSLKQAEEVQYGSSRLDNFMTDLSTTGAVLATAITGNPGDLTTDLALVTATGVLPLVPKELSPGRYVEWNVRINRKGDKIACESDDGGDREIFVFSKRGLADVSNHRAADWNPAWSPDGEWIAFESFRNGRRGIYRTYPETSRVFPIAVTENADNWAPAWSPDGEWLAFVSDRTGDPEIFITHIDGKPCVQVTHHPGPDYAPAWRPEDDE